MQEYIVKVYEDRTEWYNKEGKLHRENGPAIEWADGDKFYYKNGILHREDGPAIEFANGDKAYWIEGKNLSEEEFNNRNKETQILKDFQEFAEKHGYSLVKH